MVQQQLLTFDADELADRFDEHAPEACLIDFEGVPGLTYWPNFLSSEEHLEVLREIDARDWLDDLKRRVQHYGYRYDYKARRVDRSMYLGKLPEFARSIAARLYDCGLMSHEPDQVIVNEYKPGQGITPHIDCEPCFGDRIATISLGWMYTMDLADTKSDAKRHIQLELGSCLVFSGESRYRWKHGIKPRLKDNGVRRERRVSMTFRTVVLQSLS